MTFAITPIDQMEYASDAEAQAAYYIPNISTFSKSITGGGNFDQNYNIRMVIPAANISTSGNRIRLKITGYSNDGSVSSVTIGERSGSTGDFASTPTRLTFSGNNGCTIPSTGIYSDPVDFALDETKDYLVHFSYLGPNRGVSQISFSGTNRYYKATSSDECLTTTISGYTGDSNFDSVGAIEIIDESIMAYSESSIVAVGQRSLKCIAEQTNSLNKSLVRTLSTPLDLSGKNNFRGFIQSSRTGSNIKIGLHDSGGTTTEITPNITSVGAWQMFDTDISVVSDANKDAIDQIIVTIVDADSDNTFYLESLFAVTDPVLASSKMVGYLSLSAIQPALNVSKIVAYASLEPYVAPPSGGSRPFIFIF